MTDTFKFELVSPERLLMSEDVREVVVPGTEGDFTVLPDHAPVLSSLRPGVLEITSGEGKERRVFIRNSFAEVGPQSLIILSEQAIDMADLDAESLASNIRDLEEDIADAKEESIRDRAQQTLEQLKQVQEQLIS